MKKLILKTALITFGATIIVLVAVFGLMSLWAPSVMMDLTASLGMDGISGDYAYQEYERSNNVSYLARSFVVAAESKDNGSAEKRFEELIKHEEFETFCSEQDSLTLTEDRELSYRNYVCGLGACVKYRTAETAADKEAACDYAIDQTDSSFPVGNPVIILATEAIANKDQEFCNILLEKVVSADTKFDNKAADYESIFRLIKGLLGVAYEN